MNTLRLNPPIFGCLLIVGLSFFACDPPEKEAESTISETVVKTPENGDLNKTFKDEGNASIAGPKKTEEQVFQQKRRELIEAGWSENEIQNGQLPSCYNFKPRKGKYNNYLEVEVGSGTDVAIKLMNQETEKCVRYVFVNSSSTFRINKIPEGVYYLKIAYGKTWLSKIQNGQCKGKFIRSPMYEKGEDILDFNIRPKANGYSVPSYSLHLDVISTSSSNSFNSANITEDDFNK